MKPVIHLDPWINNIILDRISKRKNIDRHRLEEYDLLSDEEKRILGDEAKFYSEFNWEGSK